MNEKWSITKALKVWGDLEYHGEHGKWENSTPDWVKQIKKRHQFDLSIINIMLIAYKKCAETFIDEYIKAGRNEQSQ